MRVIFSNSEDYTMSVYAVSEGMGMIEALDRVKTTCLRELFTLAGATTPLKAPGLGLTEKLVLDIQNLSNREMTKLAGAYCRDIIQVSIDTEKLEMLVRNIKRIDEETNGAIEFIQRGASIPLMEKLFGLGTSEVTALRKGVGVTPAGGRPRCTIEQRFDIQASWQKHSETEERARYMAVANETELSLKVIHMVVMQSENDAIVQSGQITKKTA